MDDDKGLDNTVMVCEGGFGHVYPLGITDSQGQGFEKDIFEVSKKITVCIKQEKKLFARR